jgi:flagellar basal-body rod modification protein FlgD
MTSPINGLAAVTGTTGSTPTTSTSKNAMDRDLFLKLLVAQLKYQDPSKPADSSQFLAQTAQFSMVEKLEELARSQQSMVAAQLMTSATNLIGRTVTYAGLDGFDVTGVVKSATISGSNPTVRVGNTDVALSSVKEVRTTTPNQ